MPPGVPSAQGEQRHLPLQVTLEVAPEQRRIWPGEDSSVIREQGNESRALAEHVSFLRGKKAAEPGEAEQS